MRDATKAGSDAGPDGGPAAAVLGELVRLAPGLDRLLTEGLRRRGLTRARARLLLALREEPATMTALARSLEITPRAVTALVDGLEDLAFVARTPHPSDRRATLVKLTPAGRRMGRDMQESYGRLARELLGGTPARDLATTRRVLVRVREGFGDRAAIRSVDRSRNGRTR